MQRLLAALALAAGLVAASPGTARALEPQNLIGTWHVLAHYKDSASDHPDRERWVDRVWKFEWEGKNLKWTDYPIVVFTDETGRFERLGTNRQSRILEYWEPNETQLADIADGLEVNQRGSKSKTLKPVGGDWSSAGRAQPQSMKFISYVETWSIRSLGAGTPVFERSDSLSSGMTETLDGVSRYTTESTAGGTLRGRYERDGTQVGTFQMRPTQQVDWVKGSGKTQNERFREMAVSQYAASGDPEIEKEVAKVLQSSLAESGINLPSATLADLSKRVVALYAQGKSPEEIQKIVENDFMTSVIASQYSFAMKGAEHDAGARYVLPFASAAPRQLSQGNNGRFSHYGTQSYAFDFRMPVGDTIVAAREGKVVAVVDEYDRGGPAKSLLGKANVVVVLHDDGSFATYAHLSKGAAVAVGDRVAAGDALAKSGNTGYTTAPHLHFAVFVLDEEGQPESVPIRFAGKGPEGFVPAEGIYYGGPGWKAEAQ